MTPTARDTVVGQLDTDVQRLLVDEVRAVCRAARLVRPVTPGGIAMRVRVSAAGRLGWVGDGAYRYADRDRHGKPWPLLPPRWAELADAVAGPHPWDSAIVNWYDPGAALGWHVDMAEADTQLPIVTISLGDAASWAVRADERAPITRCILETGAVTLLAGPTRRYRHTIERIIPSPLLSPLLGRGRISITLRVAGRAAPLSWERRSQCPAPL